MNNDLKITVAIMLTSHFYLLSSCIATACAINGAFFSYAAIATASQPMPLRHLEPATAALIIADRGSGRLNDEPDDTKRHPTDKRAISYRGGGRSERYSMPFPG